MRPFIRHRDELVPGLGTEMRNINHRRRIRRPQPQNLALPHRQKPLARFEHRQRAQQVNGVEIMVKRGGHNRGIIGGIKAVQPARRLGIFIAPQPMSDRFRQAVPANTQPPGWRCNAVNPCREAGQSYCRDWDPDKRPPICAVPTAVKSGAARSGIDRWTSALGNPRP